MTKLPTHERQLPIEALRDRLAGAMTVAPVCSRLGHDALLHRHICRFLTRSLMECRARDGLLLVGCGTAIEPWALRAAELFKVEVLRIAVGKEVANADVSIAESDPLHRDAAIIELADRIDAAYVRPGGKIAGSLHRRIQQRNDASTRVAISPNHNCAAHELIAAGAIGWYLHTSERTPPPRQLTKSPIHDDQWTRIDGEWLIHCTRAPRANWPDETPRQYRDSLLIGDRDSVDRRPIDALCRIIRTGRIIAGATATRQQHPVVCFSAVRLAELLQRRCFRPQLGRWDYEPYGVAVRRTAAEKLGIQPVVYGEATMRKTLDPSDRYRFHPTGTTFDWQSEREWRSPRTVDLKLMGPDDVRIFAEDSAESRSRLVDCEWPVTYVSPLAAKGV